MSFNGNVKQFADNTYMLFLRDVVQPFLVVVVTGFGGWGFVDYMDTRTRVITADIRLETLKDVVSAERMRLSAIEDATFETANTRFTDNDGLRMESRLQSSIKRIEERLDRLEDRINALGGK